MAGQARRSPEREWVVLIRSATDPSWRVQRRYTDRAVALGIAHAYDGLVGDEVRVLGYNVGEWIFPVGAAISPAFYAARLAPEVRAGRIEEVSEP